MGCRVGTGQCPVEVDGVNRVVAREPAREVHLVTRTGTQELEDGFDARAVGVAIKAAGPPRVAQHRCRFAGGVERGAFERGLFERQPTRPVTPHPDPTVLVDDGEGVEAGKRDVGNRRGLERRAAGDDALGGVPELERDPSDPEAGFEGIEGRERIDAVAGHDLGGIDTDDRRASPAHRGDRGSGW